MGNLSLCFPFRELQWDGANIQVTNDPDANAHVRHPCRHEWTP